MIHHIHDLQTPFLGHSLEVNAVFAYEEDGESRIRMFYSQEQAMEILDGQSTEHAATAASEKFREQIRRCGLPLSSMREPVTISGPAARFLSMARQSMDKCAIFTSDSTERVLMYVQVLDKNDPVGVLFVVDETTARHVYIVHDRREARIVLETLRCICPPGSHKSRLWQLEESSLPEESQWPAYHIEHDAASYLGTSIEYFWVRQRLPLAGNLISE